MNEFERMILLRSIDSHWTDHIDTMDQLRQGIHLRSYAQQIHYVTIKMKVMNYLIS